MSRSIHAPWIKDNLQDILQAKPGPDGTIASRRVEGTRCVQIIAINENIKSFTISDTDVFVHTFLTTECFEELLNNYSIETLKYCHINLVDFCFSTATQAAGNQNMFELSQKMRELQPFAIHCFKVTYLGASDCSVIGSPKALNSSKALAPLLRTFQYCDLKKQLGLAQFPIQKVLPDWEGAFEDEVEFTTETSITMEHFDEPEDQARIIDALMSYDYPHIVSILPALLVDEYGAEAVPATGAGGRSGNANKQNKGTNSISNSSSNKANTSSSNDKKKNKNKTNKNKNSPEDGWTETMREDFDGYDEGRIDWSAQWLTQTETQGASEILDTDFQIDSDQEDDEETDSGNMNKSTGHGGGRGIQHLQMEMLSSLSMSDNGTGTQCSQFDHPLINDDGTADGACRQNQTQSQNQSQSLPSVSDTSDRTEKQTGNGTAKDRRHRLRSANSSAISTPTQSPKSRRSSQRVPKNTPVLTRAQRSQRSLVLEGQKRVRQNAPALQTLRESDDDAEVDSDVGSDENEKDGGVPSQERLMRALFSKLSQVPELQENGRGEVASQRQATGCSQHSNNQQASADNHLTGSGSIGVVPSQEAQEGSSNLLLTDSQLGWLDRQQNPMTQQELDMLFNWSSQHASQFLFSVPAAEATSSGGPSCSATSGPSSSAISSQGLQAQPSALAAHSARHGEAAVSATAPVASFVCVEDAVGSPSPSTRTTNTIEATGEIPQRIPCALHPAAQIQPQLQTQLHAHTQVQQQTPSHVQPSPALFQTQLSQVHHSTDTPSRPFKHPTDPGSHLSQSSYQSEDSQNRGHVMINNNDSAPNLIMSKTGKFITFRPAYTAKELKEAKSYVHARVKIIKSDGGVLPGFIQDFDGRLFQVLYDDGHKESFDLTQLKRWIKFETDPLISKTSEIIAQKSAALGQPNHRDGRMHHSSSSSSNSSSSMLQPVAAVSARRVMTSTEAFLYCESDTEPQGSERGSGGSQQLPASRTSGGNSGSSSGSGGPNAGSVAVSDAGTGSRSGAGSLSGIALVHGEYTPATFARTISEILDENHDEVRNSRTAVRNAEIPPYLTLTPEAAAAMSLQDLIKFFAETPLPQEFVTPSVSSYEFNVENLLRALPGLLQHWHERQTGTLQTKKRPPLRPTGPTRRSNTATTSTSTSAAASAGTDATAGTHSAGVKGNGKGSSSAKVVSTEEMEELERAARWEAKKRRAAESYLAANQKKASYKRSRN